MQLCVIKKVGRVKFWPSIVLLPFVDDLDRYHTLRR